MRVGAADAEGVDGGPARAGAAGPGVSLSATVKGLPAKSIAGFGRSKPRLAGISPWRRASSALMRPTMPAAVSRWPILVFTEPTRQKPVRPVLWRKAWVSAAISIGSPR
ncbi:hypothetical protein GCM10025880_32730 [Methylorubrum aminovorans]|nr:hypothetical protein GCM10025880_32730 [Methylorubrum aminovorans]